MILAISGSMAVAAFGLRLMYLTAYTKGFLMGKQVGAYDYVMMQKKIIQFPKKVINQ